MASLYIEHKSENLDQKTVVVNIDRTDSTQESEEREIVRKTEELAIKALAEVEHFYRTSLTKNIHVVITDRAGMDDASGHKTVRWGVGMATSNGLYLLDPRLYANTAEQLGNEPETDHTYDDESYFVLIKHELGHVVFKQICGIPYSRLNFLRWFNEGTQFYMAGQIREARKFDTNFIENGNDDAFYQNSATVIKNLVQTYGKEGFKDRLLYILNDLGNAYPEIMNDMSEPVSTRLRAVFDKSFEEAFGIKPTPEEILRFVEST